MRFVGVHYAISAEQRDGLLGQADDAANLGVGVLEGVDGANGPLVGRARLPASRGADTGENG